MNCERVQTVLKNFSEDTSEQDVLSNQEQVSPNTLQYLFYIGCGFITYHKNQINPYIPNNIIYYSYTPILRRGSRAAFRSG